MDIKRAWQSFRLLILFSSKKRGDYVRKHHIYGGCGKDVRLPVGLIPLRAENIFLHNNIEVASGAKFVPHDAIHSVFNHMGEEKYKEHVGRIEVFDNVFIAGQHPAAELLERAVPDPFQPDVPGHMDQHGPAEEGIEAFPMLHFHSGEDEIRMGLDFAAQHGFRLLPGARGGISLRPGEIDVLAVDEMMPQLFRKGFAQCALSCAVQAADNDSGSHRFFSSKAFCN